MSNWRIPLSDLDFGAEEQSAVLRVLASKWLSMGPEVQAFEKEFADLLGVKFAYAVANATAGLHLSFLALGLGPGDEVIQPAINFVASANMTMAVGARPVFADIISVEEPTIDPAEIERLITPRTKAVIVMHYGGYFCRMKEILEICRNRNIRLIEDACHAVGARYINPLASGIHTRYAGAIGDIAAFSFFSNKNLATGEGGMVVTNRGDLAEKLKLLRSHGMTTLTWDRHKGHASSYDVVEHGFNYRLTELAAAIGRAQLAKLPSNNRKRGDLVTCYKENLKGASAWTVPFREYNGDSAYHLMAVLAPSPEARMEAAQKLGVQGVQTSKHYPCVTFLTAFKKYHSNKLRRSEQFADRVLSLPLFPTLAASDIPGICSVISGKSA